MNVHSVSCVLTTGLHCCRKSEFGNKVITTINAASSALGREAGSAWGAGGSRDRAHGGGFSRTRKSRNLGLGLDFGRAEGPSSPLHRGARAGIANPPAVVPAPRGRRTSYRGAAKMGRDRFSLFSRTSHRRQPRLQLHQLPLPAARGEAALLPAANRGAGRGGPARWAAQAAQAGSPSFIFGSSCDRGQDIFSAAGRD